MTAPSKYIKSRAMLTVENITKSFGSVCAVRDISFHVRRGEVVGLLGPNGAGKSTTMRMITGFLQPDRGTVRIGVTAVADDPIGTRRQIGYLPESAPLYHDMEVTHFLRFIAELRGIPRSEHQHRLDEMITTCALRDVVGRPVGHLSKGFRQRVGLAAAMIHQPPLLILDEPTSGLDPNQINEIRQVIRAIGRERTVILSTHILQEVEAVCDRALIIHQGALVGAGSLHDLVQQKQGGVRYYLKINAAEPLVRDRASQLQSASVVNCHPVEGDWHEAIISSGNGLAGEDIFQWAVGNGWQLRELRREAASLEDVFRELTTGS